MPGGVVAHVNALGLLVTLLVWIAVPAVIIGIVVLFYIRLQRIEELLREIRDSLGGRFPEA